VRRLFAASAPARSVTRLVVAAHSETDAPATTSAEKGSRVSFRHIGGPTILDLDAVPGATKERRSDVH